MKRKRAPIDDHADPHSPEPSGRTPLAVVRLLVLAAIAAFYLPSLNIPFLGDDYVFLDKTRLASFGDLWSRSNTDFGWYRPWSREFHFWLIQHLAGPNPMAFRACNLVLFASSLIIFSEAIRRLAGPGIAAMLLVGVATLGLWGAPLLWISGSQDLWMFFFVSLGLWCVATRRDLWALPAFVGALLSKETGAVFPVLVLAVWRSLRQERWSVVALRMIPFGIVAAAWLLFHPLLSARLQHGRLAVPGAEDPLPAAQVVFKTLLAMLNADQIGDALMPTPGSAIAMAIGGAILVVAMWFASRPCSKAPDAPSAGRLARVGGVWALAGWLPLFLPSISWHAYYGCLGAVGAWLVLVAWLGQKRKALVGFVVLVGILRVFNTSSRAWDWGSEWYQRRAGLILGSIQTQLLQQYPELPAHTRVYFGSIPNNVGLVAGSSPAVRVWYRDSTLKAGFYSYYRPREAGEPPGRDLFFHFDSTFGLREVRLGPEDMVQALKRDPEWEANHEALANTLLRAGDPQRAGDELEKIALLPSRPDAYAYAGLCREMAGDSSRAEQLFERAHSEIGGTREQFSQWLSRLRRAMPRPSPVAGKN